ncbi:hypothetical protein HK102_012368 [Quaeritorhiza haematococci]|nr:hypothetical protein HK102_012368 [Quaeritorhiza haematococci]
MLGNFVVSSSPSPAGTSTPQHQQQAHAHHFPLKPLAACMSTAADPRITWIPKQQQYWRHIWEQCARATADSFLAGVIPWAWENFLLYLSQLQSLHAHPGQPSRRYQHMPLQPPTLTSPKHTAPASPTSKKTFGRPDVTRSFKGKGRNTSRSDEPEEASTRKLSPRNQQTQNLRLTCSRLAQACDHCQDCGEPKATHHTTTTNEGSPQCRRPARLQQIGLRTAWATHMGTCPNNPLCNPASTVRSPIYDEATTHEAAQLLQQRRQELIRAKWDARCDKAEDQDQGRPPDQERRKAREGGEGAVQVLLTLVG